MFGLPVLIMALWQWQPGRITLCVAGGLLAVDLAYGYGKRYAIFLRQQQPRDAELMRCSHGAGILALFGLGLWTVGAAQIDAFLSALRAAPDDWQYAGGALAFAAVALWGVVWFISGARRSLAFAGFRDSRLITRATMKIGAAAAVWMIWNYPPASWWAWAYWLRAVPYSGAAVLAVVIWLGVTGLVKLVLVLWARYSAARDMVAQDIAAQDFHWDGV
jgi:hypothetical protein